MFHKLYAEFWGPRLEYILRNSLLSLLHNPAPRLSDVPELLTNPRFRTNLLMRLSDPTLKRFWVDEFETMPDRLRAEAIAPILNKVGQFVSSPLVRAVVNTPESSIKVADAINEGKVLLVNLFPKLYRFCIGQSIAMQPFLRFTGCIDRHEWERVPCKSIYHPMKTVPSGR